MRRDRPMLTLAVAGVVLVASIMLIAGIFRLRTTSGDVYAPYSTFRADPLGTMALYEALAALPGTEVQRFVQPFDELPHGAGATLLIAGAGLSLDPVAVLEDVESFAAQGGRVVIAFHPVNSWFPLDALRDAMESRNRAARGDQDDPPAETPEEEDPAEAQDGDAPAPEDTEAPATDPPSPGPEDDPPADGADASGKNDADTEEEETPIEHELVDISERWSFAYNYLDPEGVFPVAPADATQEMEKAVTWISGLYFHGPDDTWRPVMLRPGAPDDAAWITVMEKDLGAGTLVLSSDSYFLSNEGLRKDRAPQFLSWLVGPNSRVLFSEVHLGTAQRERVMTLVRRYRLHGLLLGCILLGALFVWRNATSLLPRVERDPTRAGSIRTHAERSHQDGLDNLLARFLPPDQLLGACVDEWLQQFHNHPKAPHIRALRARMTENQARFPSNDHLVATYNRLVDELHNRG